MSESKKTYKFLGGKHYVYAEGIHKLLEKGETVEMTDKVFYGVRDRFELVTDPTSKSESEPPGWETLLGGNVEHTSVLIGRVESEESLDAIEVAENAAGARIGVLKAIALRRAELDG